jgi:hypothetical protein
VLVPCAFTDYPQVYSKMQNLEKLVLRIAPNKFHFLKFILEGYDNMAILSSLNSKDGLVVIRYPANLTKDLFALLASIGKKIS